MLHRELIFLTFLVLLCQHGVKAVNIIECEDDLVTLFCAQGTIKVGAVFYGRENPITCINALPDTDTFLPNTNCSLSTALSEAAQCDGKTRCTITPRSFFTDPCPGNMKYMKLSYECIITTTTPTTTTTTTTTTTPPPNPPKREIICHGEHSDISCERGRRLFIKQADYGRRDKKTCPSHHATFMHRPCISSQTKYLQKRCNGKRRCQLHAENKEFPNQCPNAHKYLEVTYTCV